MADFPGESNSSTPTSQAVPAGSGESILSRPMSQSTLGGAGSIAYYSLACFDNVGVRHYWTDTSVSMTNAPGGFTYVTSTLTVLG